MFQLSDEQVDIIYERLHREGLKSVKLEQDLFDHFCCHMEEQMQEGVKFEEAYYNALNAIAPNGAKEIEFELFFIMNFNKQITMKKLIFLVGFISAFLLSTGIMFSNLHWIGTNILLFSGFALLLFTMALLLIHTVWFLRNQSGVFWLRTVTGIASLAFLAIGFMFKTFQVTGANVLFGLGTVMLNFLFLPMFFYHLYKNGFVKTVTNETA